MSTQKPPDVNLGPGIIAANFVLGGVAFLIVAFRLYTRFWIKPVAGWDDILILLAIICALAYSAVETVQIVGGHYGHHTIYITFPELIIDKKTNPAENILFSFAVLFSRASICVLLLRILHNVKQWTVAIYIALALDVAASIISIVSYAIFCVPVEKGWNPHVDGFCIPKTTVNKLNQAVAAIYVVVDFMCAGIPFITLRKVQIERRVKLLLIPLLMCGLLTAACSIGRLASFHFQSKDPQYQLVPLSYWTAAEMYGAIIFASIPALRQLYAHVYEFKTLGRSSASWTPHSGGSSNFNSYFRSRKRSMPNVTAVTRHDSHAAPLKSDPPGAITRTTDVYIELEDADGREREGGRREWKYQREENPADWAERGHSINAAGTAPPKPGTFLK